MRLGTVALNAEPSQTETTLHGLSDSPIPAYDIHVRHRVLNRLSASLLLVVFLATGALRALDAAVYHGDSGEPGAGVARLLGTDAPKAHYDRCVLGAELRGSSTLPSCPAAPAVHGAVFVRPPAVPAWAPRSSPLHTTRARAPPALPA
jgi:hypothetical protein